jgi:hypothetical protein
MATKKISQLNTITTIADDDTLPIVDADVVETKKVTASNLQDYILGDATPAEINYIHGVTSAIQTQINSFGKLMVFSRPLYGIAGDTVLTITKDTPQTIANPTYAFRPGSDVPACPSGYSRYVRFRSIHGDNVSSGTYGLQLEIYNTGNVLQKTINWGKIWGAADSRGGGFNTGETTIFGVVGFIPIADILNGTVYFKANVASTAQAGAQAVLRWLEMIVYDIPNSLLG